jgi:uncharacterized protein (DUF1501 family)
MSVHFSRRGALGGLLGMGAGLCLPRRLWSSPIPKEEGRFLFIFADGGWDTTHVFTPMFGVSGVDMPSESTLASAGGIDFVDAASRPSVRAFFEEHGARACVINGIEVPTVAHNRARRLLCTGHVDGTEDWAAQLAAGSEGLYMAPHLVISGPAFATENVDQIVRTGLAGQLGDLVEGRVVGQADGGHAPLPGGAADMVAAHLRAQTSARADALAGMAGEAARHADAWALAQEQAQGLRELAGLVDLSPDGMTSPDRSSIAPELGLVLSCFEAGVARCAMVEHPGRQGVGWDTHANNDFEQDAAFEAMFSDLGGFMAGMAGRHTASGTPLSEVVTVVILSEMGRHPQINANQGKDHWPDTSALLVGAGVAGGRVIGGLGDDFSGMAIDLESGEAHGEGTRLQAKHLGATLLALGGGDPGALAPPIGATLAP